MKKLLLKSSLILISAAMMQSCATVSNITVNNVSETETMQEGSFFYALPQTVLDIGVVYEETSIVPGPFQRWAEKYLGIQNAPSKAEKIYSLKSISISRHLEADPDFIYTVKGVNDPEQWPGLKYLLRDSLILSANSFSDKQASGFNWPAPSTDVLFTDLSVKRNFEAEKDVEISLVLPDPDTDEVVAPRTSARTVLKEKTPEQKAEEAANFLIKLKKRRFKLVAGQYDYMPDGESMEAALNELARIEQEYLALFIGRKLTNEYQRNFHFTPETAEKSKRTVLFRFSNTKGLLPANESEGIPVILELQPMNKLREMNPVRLPSKHPTNTLPYRIADQVSIRLLAGEQVWAEAFFPVYQFGAPVSLVVSK